MAAPRSLCLLRLATRAAGPVSGSCGGLAPAPPCPPCPPRAPPPCRQPQAGPPHGVRVVCCPPGPVGPPPCAPTSCTLTCGDTKYRSDQKPRIDAALQDSEGQDCVSWRIQYAKCMRQLDYEREVTCSANDSCVGCETPPAPYRLGGDREQALATDGHLYTIASSSGAKKGCSCTGEPPPPRHVTLEDSNRACHYGHSHMDPCTHQPRVFLEIDRSATKTQKKEPTAADTSCATNQNDNDFKGGASRVGDFGWCKNPPPFPGAPQSCRPLTVVERLRTRPSRLMSPKSGEKGTRDLHTSVAASSAADGLQELLKAKEQLHAAGRGRVVTRDCSPKPSQPKNLEGRLDMCVPPTANRVRVHVYLDGVDCSEDATQQACDVSDQVPHSQNKCFVSSCKGDNWLSIKNIQKKLSGKPDRSKCAAPCAPCPTRPAAGAPRAPCPRPTCAPCPRPTCAPCPRPTCAPAPGDGPKPPPPCPSPTRRASSSVCIANSLVADPF